MSAAEYRNWADAVFVAHAAFIAFVVIGLLVIVVGGACGWKWIRNPWFRAAHLVAIAVVVLQAWFGMLCPLTTVEMTLRKKAGDPTYSGSFIAHWLNKLLYFEAPPWVFAVCYTLFGLTVLFTWFKYRPRSFRRPR